MLACLLAASARLSGWSPPRAVERLAEGSSVRRWTHRGIWSTASATLPRSLATELQLHYAALCAKSAHQDLPLALMAGTVALANGATASVFPGTCSPLMLCILKIDFPQTRKSSSFGMLAKLAHKLDQGVLTRARAKETAFLQEFGLDDAGDEGPSQAQTARRVQNVNVVSSTLTACTEAAFFQARLRRS